MTTSPLSVEGSTDAPFASVKRLFERDLGTLAERNAQLCVYVGEDKVIDLWGSAIGDSEFHSESIVNVFSSGKSLESIAVGYLVSQGRLQYDDKISQHWPEFANQGKQDLTVADLMRHEAGLAAFNISIDPEDLTTANIKNNAIGKIIENHPQRFAEGDNNQREYHAVTRGWIVNELFRRADEKSRTVGEFLQQEISQPLEANAMIGVPENDLDKRSAVKMLPIGYHLRESFKPVLAGRRVKDNIFQLGAKLLPLAPRMRNRNKDAAVPFTGMSSVEFFNEASIAQGETPSANAHCSARGLAKIAAMMANGGSFDGNTYLSSDAWHQLHSRPVTRSMAFSTTFTQGGVAKFGEQGSSRLQKAANKGREGFYGWMGLGGSIFQWHPELKIGFAYVPTSLHAVDVVNERGKVFQQEVLRCLKRN